MFRAVVASGHSAGYAHYCHVIGESLSVSVSMIDTVQGIVQLSLTYWLRSVSGVSMAGGEVSLEGREDVAEESMIVLGYFYFFLVSTSRND